GGNPFSGGRYHPLGMFNQNVARAAHPPKLPDDFPHKWHELPPELQKKLRDPEKMAGFKRDWDGLIANMKKGPSGGPRTGQKLNFLDKGWIFGGPADDKNWGKGDTGNWLNCWYKPKAGGGNVDSHGGSTEFEKRKTNSPLTFDLNGNGKVDTTGISKAYDLDGDGKIDQIAWAGKGDGVLAFDANGDGTVGADGKELLGNNTDVNGDGKRDGFNNGFEALRALAIRHLGEAAVADGKLDAAELQALTQKAGLSMLVDGENKSLAELGITEVNLGYTEAGLNPDENGNQHRQVGVGFTRNGEANQALNDVWFQMIQG
ncbi:hypothetical protein, partial [Veronia pacifica]|uniref:hypothetical protein n=2 Tax=Veronia pacifica TaxID=1080227 RepID=UPI00363088C9